MSPLKQVIAPLVLLLALVGIYTGAYLPLHKGQSYISALRSFQQQPTLENLEQSYTAALEVSSPVGQDEVIRFIGSGLLPLLNEKVPEAGVRELVRYFVSSFNKYQRPVSALNYSQLLLTTGGMNQVLWELYKDKDAYKVAEQLFISGLAGSPNRPQFLISLRNLYQSAGEKEKAAQINTVIKGFWPDQS